MVCKAVDSILVLCYIMYANKGIHRADGLFESSNVSILSIERISSL